MALEKPFVPIVIPPADRDEIERDRVAQMLEGCQYLYASDASFVDKLHHSVRQALSQTSSQIRQLIADLQSVASQECLPPEVDKTVEADRRNGVASALARIGEDYRLHRPKKALSSAWSSLGTPDCHTSIVENIIRSLENGKPETTVAVIGVSLKYSLNLITEALGRARRPPVGGQKPTKVLRVLLVHMDSQANILHALSDSTDIREIRHNFDGDKWTGIYESWKTLCETAWVTLEAPVLHRIDYVPPRVGILIDDRILYAGRCTINIIGEDDIPIPRALPATRNGTPGSANFYLKVGENEYFYYKRSEKGKASDPNDPAYRAIREFKCSLVAYSISDNNTGITPVWSSDEWITRLQTYIKDGAKDEEITFISATSRRFEPLIREALQQRAKVRVFVQELRTTAVREARARLLHCIGSAVETAEVAGYKHSATFRAVVIGDRAIGLQPYVSIGAKLAAADAIKKLPLCFIATTCFNRFAELKSWVLGV